MIDDVSDDRLDAFIRKQRPKRVRTTRAWRQSQRQTLLAHINATQEAAVGDVESDRGRTQRELHPEQSSREPSRSWGWAAAGVLVLAGVGALAFLPDSGPDAEPSSLTPGAPSLPIDAEIVPVGPAQNMVAPGVTVSPEVGRLLSLPVCDSAEGLAEWTAMQLQWWRDLDPATAQPALFSEVTASVAVDTAAASATCSTAIAVDGALTWGLGDGTGNWVARATGVPDASDYEWPVQERERNGDDGTGGQFGTGQFFNDFNVRTTALEPIAAGALSPAAASSPSPIYVVEFAEEVPLDADPSRLWYLRTTAPVLDENVSGQPDPALVPSLVPQGFGQCTVEYVRQNAAGQSAFAIDYCNETSTITVTVGRIVDGDPIVVDGIEMLVERNDDIVSIGLRTDGPMVIGPSGLSERALADTLASIPATRANTDSDAPNQRQVDATAAIDAAFQEALDALRPDTEYFVATWAAREIVMARCMTDAGFEWQARPNDAASDTDQWAVWEEWFEAQAATDSSFETAAFGDDALNDTNVGGCQLEAGREVHGPGEEAFSRAADLENEVLASKLQFVDTLEPTVDIDAAASAVVATWLEENSAAIQDIGTDIADELATARSVIANAELSD